MDLNSLVIVVPIAVAIITSIVAPIMLSRRQSASNLNTEIIEEGRTMRQELRARIDKLEARLDAAQEEVNKALDSMRQLRSENERLKSDLEDCQVRISTLEDDK